MRRAIRPAVRLLALALALAAPAAAIVATTACREGAETHARYHCPMHPTYISDRPGDCPICGMALVPIEPAQAAGPSAVGEARGTNDVQVSGEGVALAGIATEVAALAPMERRVRTVGTVLADETRVQHVHTKISGWVEKLFVSYTGQSVRKGQPILSIFSPELLATQEEYVQSLRAAEALGPSASADVRAASGGIVEAGRRRLELLDVPRGTVEEIARGGAPQRSVTLVAPVSGFVTAKQIFAGQQVDPGTELFTVTDFRRVWIEAAVYESDAPLVRVGQRAAFSFPYDPGRKLESAVSYIYPYLDTATRTQKVRFDVDNADLALKPGMFVDVDLEVRSERGVVIPDSAIIDTGARQIVYVEVAAGRFTARRIEVGSRAGGRALVLAGVAAGERVVVKGNFLLDSESRLGAAAALPDSGVAP
jgi:membrane fusion protein, copper/silver efflux system